MKLIKSTACILLAAMSMASCSVSIDKGTDEKDNSKIESTTDSKEDSVKEETNEEVEDSKSDDTDKSDDKSNEEVSVNSIIEKSSKAMHDKKSVSMDSKFNSTITLSYGGESLDMPFNMTYGIDITPTGYHLSMNANVEYDESLNESYEQYAVFRDDNTAYMYTNEYGYWTLDEVETNGEINIDNFLFDKDSNIFDGATAKETSDGYVITQSISKFMTSNDTSMVGLVNSGIVEMLFVDTMSDNLTVDYTFDKDYILTNISYSNVQVKLDAESILGEPGGEASMLMSYNIDFKDWDSVTNIIVPDSVVNSVGGTSSSGNDWDFDWDFDIPDVDVPDIDLGNDSSKAEPTTPSSTSKYNTMIIDGTTITVPSSNISMPSDWSLYESTDYSCKYLKSKNGTDTMLRTRLRNDKVYYAEITVNDIENLPSLKIGNNITWASSVDEIKADLGNPTSTETNSTFTLLKYSDSSATMYLYVGNNGVGLYSIVIEE